MPLRVTPNVTIPDDEIVVRASRSSGPGGQHANVTASRIEASFDVAASRTLSEEQKRRVLDRCGPRVVGVAQDARSQARNRDLALERLARRLAQGAPRPAPAARDPPDRGVAPQAARGQAAHERAQVRAAAPRRGAT